MKSQAPGWCAIRSKPLLLSIIFIVILLSVAHINNTNNNIEDSISESPASNNSQVIVAKHYSGWGGTESLPPTLHDYENLVANSSAVHDLYCEVYGVEDPLRYVASKPETAVVLAKVESFVNATLEDGPPGIIKITYKIKIIEIIKNFGSNDLIDNSTINVITYAYIKKDKIYKINNNITLEDLAAPYPLLDPGNTYVLFLQKLRDNTIIVRYDYAWGLWAFYYDQDNNTVISLYKIKYPKDLEFDRMKFYDRIYWFNRNATMSDIVNYFDNKLNITMSYEDFVEQVR